MAKYFKNVDSLEQLRKQYRDLLKQYHPDNGGSEEITKAINAEYDQLFKALKNKHESKSADDSDNANAKASDYSKNMYDWENDKSLREVLQKIVNFDGIEIEIVGYFIWVDGNTYPHKEALKEIGFRWSKQRRKWYWHDGEYKRYGNKNLSFADIQSRFGSTKVHTDAKVLLEA